MYVAKNKISNINKITRILPKHITFRTLNENNI